MSEVASASLAAGLPCAVSVLGPVTLDGVAPQGRSLAVLLGLLAIEWGRPVSMARIVAELWGTDPPASAHGTVQAYVSRLRTLLRPRGTVRSGPGGYSLDLPGESDAARFGELIDQGYHALDSNDAATAANHFDRALALWQGEPFGGEGGEVLGTARTRLLALRHDARTGRARSALQIGDRRRAVTLAQELVAEDPLDEPSVEVLLLALDAAGRATSALEAYASYRERLADELGTDPGPRLQELHLRLLRAEPLVASAPAPPVASPPTSLETPQYPGRTRERQALAEAVTAVMNGATPVVLISGEAGIGKTVLADFAARTGQQAGCRVVLVRALAGLTTPPFWVWDEALRRLDALPHFPEPAADSATSRFRRIEAVAAAVDTARRGQPLLLVIDDAQSCDAASLEVLRVLLARDPGALGVVIAARDHGATDTAAFRRTLGALRREAGLVELRPRPLTVEDVLGLLGEDGDPGRAAEIVARSGGNPFLVGELLDARGSELPDSTVAAVADRLAMLPEATVEVVGVAALAGSEIDGQLVAAALGIAAAELADAWAEAVDEGLLVADADGVRFRHDLVREAIVELTPARARTTRHARIADALEQIVVADPERVAELAHHRFAASGGTTSIAAADALLRAADQASARLGYERAAQHRQRALRVLPAGPAFAPRRLDALQRLIEERRLAGDPIGADQALAQAIPLARAAGDRARLSVIAQIVGTPTLWNWRQFGSVEPGQIALLEELLATADEPAERARLGGALAVELAYDEDVRRRAAISDEAVAAARESGDAAVIGRVLNNFAIANWHPARRAERADALDEALALPELPAETEAIARLHRAPLAFRRGDIESAEADLSRAESLTRRLGIPELTAQLGTQRAGLALLAGHSDAQELSTVACAELARTSLWGTDWVRLGFAVASARSSGEPGAIAEELIGFAHRPEWTLVRPAAALLAAETGDAERAEALLVRWGLARLPRAEHWCGDLLLAQLAMCSARIGMPDPAACYVALLPWAGELVVAGTSIACWGPVDTTLAALAERLGDTEAAAAHATVAEQLTARVAGSLGCPPRW